MLGPFAQGAGDPRRQRRRRSRSAPARAARGRSARSWRTWRRRGPRARDGRGDAQHLAHRPDRRTASPSLPRPGDAGRILDSRSRAPRRALDLAARAVPPAGDRQPHRPQQREPRRPRREGRFVFGFLDQFGNPLQTTLIVEYNIPASSAQDVDRPRQRVARPSEPAVPVGRSTTRPAGDHRQVHGAQRGAGTAERQRHRPDSHQRLLRAGRMGVP